MAFLTPEIQFFDADDIMRLVVNGAEGFAPEYNEDRPEPPEAGYFARLSASGYLDCTEWEGPFETLEAALAYTCEIYEVDENGDPIAEDN